MGIIDFIAQLVKKSNRLSIQRMTPKELWKRVPDWAEKFNFRIEEEVLVFNRETVNDFIAALDKEFHKWGTEGKV